MAEPRDARLTYPGKFVIRTLGTIFLGVCCAMFVMGRTLWSEELYGTQYLLYWSWCLLLALLASVTALVDLCLVRHAARQQRRALILDQIQY